MITLYHAATTRSLRIYWLLEELGIPYQLKVMNYYTGDRDDPAFRKLNPMGSLPIITDDDFALVESGAIINYILRRYGNGKFSVPAGSREEALVDQWMYWAESLPAIHQRNYWDHCAPPPGCIAEPVPRLGREGKQSFIKCLDMPERALGTDGFLVGESLSGADFMMIFPFYMANMDHWLKDHPKCRAYLKRIVAREKFQKAVKDTNEMLAQLFPTREQQAAVRQAKGVA